MGVINLKMWSGLPCLNPWSPSQLYLIQTEFFLLYLSHAFKCRQVAASCPVCDSVLGICPIHFPWLRIPPAPHLPEWPLMPSFLEAKRAKTGTSSSLNFYCCWHMSMCFSYKKKCVTMNAVSLFSYMAATYSSFIKTSTFLWVQLSRPVPPLHPSALCSFLVMVTPTILLCNLFVFLYLLLGSQLLGDSVTAYLRSHLCSMGARSRFCCSILMADLELTHLHVPCSLTHFLRVCQRVFQAG